MLRFVLNPLSLLALFGLLFGGCNVLEGFYEEGVSDDPDVLIEDAEIAIQSGTPEKAVVYLEKAIEKAPEGSPVQKKAQMNLSTALLQSNKISVLTLERMARDLQARFEDKSAAAAGKGAYSASQGYCSFPEAHTDTVQVDLRDIDGYSEIHESTDVLEEVQSLVNRVLDFEGEDPGERFNIGARIDSLRNEAGFSDEQIATTLLNGSIAYIGTSYDFLVEQGAEDITWYAVTPPESEDAYLGYCAPSEARVEEVKAATACSMGDIRFSVDLLEARANLPAFRNTLATEIATLADEAYVKLSQEVTGECPVTG